MGDKSLLVTKIDFEKVLLANDIVTQNEEPDFEMYPSPTPSVLSKHSFLVKSHHLWSLKHRNLTRISHSDYTQTRGYLISELIQSTLLD